MLNRTETVAETSRNERCRVWDLFHTYTSTLFFLPTPFYSYKLCIISLSLHMDNWYVGDRDTLKYVDVCYYEYLTFCAVLHLG